MNISILLLRYIIVLPLWLLLLVFVRFKLLSQNHPWMNPNNKTYMVVRKWSGWARFAGKPSLWFAGTLWFGFGCLVLIIWLIIIQYNLNKA